MMISLMTTLNLYAQDSDAPDMALLEFIGEGVSADNEVIDPIDWQAMEDMTAKPQHNPQTGKHTREQIPQDNRQHGNE